MEICDRIKYKRKQLGMTQTELAALTGYTNKSSIASVEAGKIDLPLSKVKIFAKALHTTPAYLLGWGEENARTSQEKRLIAYADMFSKVKDSDELLNVLRSYESQEEPIKAAVRKLLDIEDIEK